MAQYFINVNYDMSASGWSSLKKTLQDGGLPVIDTQSSSAFPGQIIVVTDDAVALTQAQQTTMNSIVAQFDPRPRTKRAIYTIYTDLLALNATQQTNVWNDFSSGNPTKYLLDQGNNAAAIAVLDWVVKKSGTSGANLTDARMRAVAMYTQDNPKYLVTPTFDATINVPGDMPIG